MIHAYWFSWCNAQPMLFNNLFKPFIASNYKIQIQITLWNDEEAAFICSTKKLKVIVTCQHFPESYSLWVRLVVSIHRPWLQVHCYPPVGLPVAGGGRGPGTDLRPRGDGRLDDGAVVVVPGARAIVGGQRGRAGRGGHDVDGGESRGRGVVVVGGRGGDGGGVVVAQLLPQTVLHVLVSQRRRVADLVL